MTYNERRTSDDAITGTSRWYVPLFIWRFAIHADLLQRQPWRGIFLRESNYLRGDAKYEPGVQPAPPKEARNGMS